MMYPDDGGLRPQVRDIKDTLSVFTVFRRHFFPWTITTGDELLRHFSEPTYNITVNAN